MSRILISIILFSLSILSCFAQSGNKFAVEGKVWHMRHDSPIPHNVSYDFDYFIQGDTLIATNECKKFYAYNEDGKQQTVYKMALYEQEGKVFFIPEDSETPYLLYDFQSNAGDTVTVFECNHPEHLQKDMSVLEVNWFSVNGVERRCERVGLQERSNRSAGWWIEGIGSELGPLNTSGFGMVGNSNYLICCELAGDTIFSLGEFQNMLLNIADEGYAHMLREGNTWHYHFMIEHADGMKVWRHKTQHKKFKYGLPLILLAQIALIYLLLNR